MQRRNRGFTLVEIAIAITVVAIIASIIVVSFLSVQKRSRDDTRRMQAKAMMSALQQYYNENGEYPNACGSVNTECPIGNLTSYLTPAYIQTIPVPPPDSSGRGYKYIRGTTANSYAIYVPLEDGGGSPCKAGKNINTTWWGGALTPICDFSSS